LPLTTVYLWPFQSRDDNPEGKALDAGPWAMQLLAVSVFRQTSPDVRVRVRRIVVAVDVPQACIQVIVPIAADIRDYSC